MAAATPIPSAWPADGRGRRFRRAGAKLLDADELGQGPQDQGLGGGQPRFRRGPAGGVVPALVRTWSKRAKNLSSPPSPRSQSRLGDSLRLGQRVRGAPELLALGIDLLSYFRGACVQVLVRRLALVPEGGVECFAERGISASVDRHVRAGQGILVAPDRDANRGRYDGDRHHAQRGDASRRPSSSSFGMRSHASWPMVPGNLAGSTSRAAYPLIAIGTN